MSRCGAAATEGAAGRDAGSDAAIVIAGNGNRAGAHIDGQSQCGMDGCPQQSEAGEGWWAGMPEAIDDIAMSACAVTAAAGTAMPALNTSISHASRLMAHRRGERRNGRRVAVIGASLRASPGALNAGGGSMPVAAGLTLAATGAGDQWPPEDGPGLAPNGGLASQITATSPMKTQPSMWNTSLKAIW